MAAQDAARGEHPSLKGTMFFQSFQRISTACGMVAAIEPHPWAKDEAVSAHWQRKDTRKRAHFFLPCRMASAFRKSDCSVAKGKVAVVPLRPIKT